MSLVKKLSLSNFTYASLIKEFTALGEEERKEVRKNHSSFLDWLIAASAEHLSDSQQNVFCKYLYDVIKEKLELVISAIGSLKLSEISSKVLRSTDFASEDFLRKLVRSKSEFEIVIRRDVEYLDIVPRLALLKKTGNKMDNCKESDDDKNEAEKKYEIDINEEHHKQNSIQNLTCNVLNCRDKTNREAQCFMDYSMTDKNDDLKAQQLLYLYSDKPDIIAALHPSASFNTLFKIYPFWKSFCSHSTNSLIAWLMDMAHYMYRGKNKSSSTQFETYSKAIKRLIARESCNYVTPKPKTIKELTVFLSKSMDRFVDIEFVFQAIRDNVDILKISKTESSVASYQIMSVSNNELELMSEPCSSKTSTSFLMSSTPSSSTQLDSMKQTSSQQNHLQSSSAVVRLTEDQDPEYFLQAVFIPVDVRAKIVPLLTVNATWENISFTYKKISSDKEQFFTKVCANCDSFVDFLISFAKRFKPSLDIKQYFNHLSEIVLSTIATTLKSRQGFTTFDEINSILANDESTKFNIVTKRFLRNVFQNEPTEYILKDKSVSLITKNNLEVLATSSSRSAKKSPPRKAKVTCAMTKEELKNLPELSIFFTSKFEFSDFLRTYKCLPARAKTLLKQLSCSFYSFLLEIARAKLFDHDQFFKHLQKVVSYEIAKLYDIIGTESMTMLDVQLKLGCGDCSLVHGLEISHALQSIFPEKFDFKDNRICLMNLKLHPAPSFTFEDHASMDLIKDRIDSFMQHVNSVLTQNDSGKEKLGKIFYGLNHLSGEVKGYIGSRRWSFYRFLVESAVEKARLHEVLEKEIFKYLYCDTMFCEEVLSGFFQFTPDFINMDEFLTFLQMHGESFAVVGHFQVGNIVSAVRQVGLGGNILFHSKMEEDTFILCKMLFPLGIDIDFSDLFKIVWNSEKFSFEQREFLFGNNSIRRTPIYNQLHFRRYLIMYPSEFSIVDEIVRLNLLSNINTDERSSTKTASSEVVDLRQSTDCSEEGELPRCYNESTCNSPKRLKLAKSPEKSKMKLEKRKNKKKRKKLKEHALKEQKKIFGLQDLNELIATFPYHFIQDVVIGRLMTSSNHELKVSEILEVLQTNLLRERQKYVDNNKTLKGEFQTKVLNVLKQSDKLLISEAEDCSSAKSQTIKLQIETPEISSSSSQHPLIVFRWIHCLTGISMAKISFYIKKILRINTTALSLSIVFAMISKKYESKKTVATTPSVILHCQAVACMMSDPELFLNIYRKTCSLMSWVTEDEKTESFQTAFDKVPKENIINFMSKCLQSDNCQDGISIESLTGKVFIKFYDDLSLLREYTQVLVQGIIGSHQSFGFTPLGEVVYQKNDAAGSSFDSVASSSEDELLIDISDDDNAVSPDSTNKRTVPETNPEENKRDVSEVIRFSQDGPVAKEPSPADSNSVGDFCSATLHSPTSTTFDPQKVPKVKRGSPGSDALSSLTYEPPKDPRTIMNSPASYPSSSSTIETPKDPRTKKKSFRSRTSVAESEVVKEKQSSQKNHVSSTSEPMRSQKHLHRVRLFEDFAIEFFLSRGYSCETQDFINSAYHRFKNERFAHSILAFEAYLRDFVATSKDSLFSFASASGNVGVSFTFYRPVRTEANCRLETKVPFIELLPEVVSNVYQFVSSSPEKKVSLDNVCDFIAARFSKTFSESPVDEVISLCRNLVLLACIRNLKWFFFARSEPFIYIRQAADLRAPKASACYEVTKQTCTIGASKDSLFTTSSRSSPRLLLAQPSSSRSSTAANTVSALEKMAELLRIHGPCKKLALRELWLAASDSNQRKVFGTGVSFSLSLRRFEAYFPTVDGLVHLDEKTFSKFLKENN